MGRDKFNSETVPKPTNFVELDNIYKWINPQQRFFLFNCGISMRGCYQCEWETHDMLMF